ncbi:MAG: heme exporter protein CcmB [Alphaproteobacteria bacterium]|nr:heme exporter protein CcmB [Alphaproteobacteria bacterium]
MLIKSFTNCVNYEVKLYARKGGEVGTVIAFFCIALTLFPFALGANNPNIATLAPAFIWVIALLSALLSLPAMFYRDVNDGSLDQLRLSSLALEWCVLAKCIANWLTCQLPLIFFAPLMAMMLGVSNEQGARLMVSLLLGTPILCCLGALGAALTLYASNKSGVLAVVVLPLYIPVLIFATIVAMSPPENPLYNMAEALLLSGLLLAVIPISCWVSAWIVRLQD